MPIEHSPTMFIPDKYGFLPVAGPRRDTEQQTPFPISPRSGRDARLRCNVSRSLAEAVGPEAILESMKSACTLMELSVYRFGSL